jgi:hypothetical protein
MSLDYKVDELGYLHLSTLEPFVFHMGNNLNDRLLAEVEQMTGQALARSSTQAQPDQVSSPIKRLLARLARRPRFNRFLVRVYNYLFQLLNTKSE